MGKCRNFWKGAARWTMDNLGPTLLNYAGQTVGELQRMADEDPRAFDSSTKRKVAEAMVRTKARELGQEVHITAIRLAIEAAVAGLKRAEGELPSAQETLDEINAGDVDNDLAN